VSVRLLTERKRLLRVDRGTEFLAAALVVWRASLVILAILACIGAGSHISTGGELFVCSMHASAWFVWAVELIAVALAICGSVLHSVANLAILQVSQNILLDYRGRLRSFTSETHANIFSGARIVVRKQARV